MEYLVVTNISLVAELNACLFFRTAGVMGHEGIALIIIGLPDS